jgi:hypothetical protein
MYSIFFGMNLVYTTEIYTPLSASFHVMRIRTKHIAQQNYFPSGVLQMNFPMSLRMDTQTTSALPQMKMATTWRV